MGLLGNAKFLGFLLAAIFVTGSAFAQNPKSQTGSTIEVVDIASSPQAAEEPSAGRGVSEKRSADGRCGAIISYNFSQGKNPRLESITTCTPSGIVMSKRANGENTIPIEPGLVQIKWVAIR